MDCSWPRNAMRTPSATCGRLSPLHSQIGQGQLSAGLAAGANGEEGRGGQTARAGAVASPGRRSHIATAASTAGARTMRGLSALARSVSSFSPRACRVIGASRREAAAHSPPPLSSQLEAAIKRDPANPKLYVALGLAYWDRTRFAARAGGVPAGGQGGAALRRGAQLAGRRARRQVRSSRRDRRVQEGRCARSQVRARLHQSRLRAGEER